MSFNFIEQLNKFIQRSENFDKSGIKRYISILINEEPSEFNSNKEFDNYIPEKEWKKINALKNHEENRFIKCMSTEQKYELTIYLMILEHHLNKNEEYFKERNEKGELNIHNLLVNIKNYDSIYDRILEIMSVYVK